MVAKKTQPGKSVPAQGHAAQEPAFCSVAEAAAWLGVSTITVRRRIDDGTLPRIQLGGKGCSVRIPAEALSQLARTKTNVNEESVSEAKPVVGQRIPKLPGPVPKWKKTQEIL
jgi:excisionase family DNA binding protein